METNHHSDEEILMSYLENTDYPKKPAINPRKAKHDYTTWASQNYHLSHALNAIVYEQATQTTPAPAVAQEAATLERGRLTSPLDIQQQHLKYLPIATRTELLQTLFETESIPHTPATITNLVQLKQGIELYTNYQRTRVNTTRVLTSPAELTSR